LGTIDPVPIKPELVCHTPEDLGQQSVLPGCDTVTAITSAAEIETSIGTYIRRLEQALRTLRRVRAPKPSSPKPFTRRTVTLTSHHRQATNWKE
jgi:hypothetical protein